MWSQSRSTRASSVVCVAVGTALRSTKNVPVMPATSDAEASQAGVSAPASGLGSVVASIP